jgi:hypothetical protein
MADLGAFLTGESEARWRCSRANAIENRFLARFNPPLSG